MKAFFLIRRVPNDNDFKKLLREVYGDLKNEELQDRIKVARGKFNEFRYDFKKNVIKLSKEYMEG